MQRGWFGGTGEWLARLTAGRGAPARQPSEATLAGLDAAITVEAASVTFVGVVRQRGADGELDLGPEATRFLEAAQCQDEAHYHFLLSVGAVPRETAFSLPAAGLADREGVLQTLTELEAIGVAVYMAAARRFAEEAEPRLVEIAYQMGAVDAQHHALARYQLGARPANDRAFARWRFVEAADAAGALAELGFGAGEDAVAFPGPVARLCAGVFGLVPETTEDALVPLPPVGTPVPPPGG